MIPSCLCKITDGWINCLCKVISYKIIEKEIDYRGSKSIMYNFIVKEQRVDGSWCRVYTPHLRCTLTGFERNYQVRILSKQINKLRFYSSVQSVVSKPWFVTGFVDGEGSFQISLVEDKKNEVRVVCRVMLLGLSTC